MATIFTDNFVRFATQRKGPGDNIEVQHIPEPIVNNALDCQSPYSVGQASLFRRVTRNCRMPGRSKVG